MTAGATAAKYLWAKLSDSKANDFMAHFEETLESLDPVPAETYFADMATEKVLQFFERSKSKPGGRKAFLSLKRLNSHLRDNDWLSHMIISWGHDYMTELIDQQAQHHQEPMSILVGLGFYYFLGPTDSYVP